MILLDKVHFILQTENDIREAYVSFMSGHACLFFQAATFLALYFQARLNLTNTFVGKNFFSCLRAKNFFAQQSQLEYLGLVFSRDIIFL